MPNNEYALDGACELPNRPNQDLNTFAPKTQFKVRPSKTEAQVRADARVRNKKAHIPCKNSSSHPKLGCSKLSFSRSHSRKLMRSLGRGSTNSGSSFRKILSRPFLIERDINKYSQELDWKQTERRVIKFEKTAFGRRVPGMEVKGNAIKFSVMWEAEKKALKNVDWF